jgi:hypothetical protein
MSHPRRQILSASVGIGESDVFAPRHGRGYWATFGAYTLCSTQAGVVPEITGVRLAFGHPAPATARAVLRLVSPRVVRAHPRDPSQHLAPMSWTLGSPPRFSETYAGVRPWGDYSHSLAGFRVTNSCKQALALSDAISAGRRPARTHAEMMIVVKSPPGGSIVESVDIDYQVNGHAMTLPVRWAMVNCGPQVASRCR